ncbi:MAG: hypothetical protein DBX43_01795 [Coriobacteriia bacterium]|nr:MAG: hypothetical protein DBX43_01795 [Coriobacteriia bacterium]
MEEIIQWPLVLFSLLAGAGGCAFAFAGASEFVGGTKRARFVVGVVSLVLVVVGGLFSVLHLASPQHVMAAVRHVFSFSGVSVELMVLGLVVVVGVAYLVLSKRSGVDGARKGFAVAGIVLGLLLAFVTGHGYVISAKAAWFTEILPIAYMGTSLAAGALLFLLVSLAADKEFSAKPWGVPVLAASIVGAVTIVAYLAYLQSAGFDVTSQALVTGLAVVCGIVVAIGCSIAILRCAAGGNRQTLTVLAAVGFVGALAGGLAVRLLMWLFSEGFMELFEAARVVLNC